MIMKFFTVSLLFAPMTSADGMLI